MMPGVPPNGARAPPIPQRRIFRAATAGAGRAHSPLAESDVTCPPEACGLGAAASHSPMSPICLAADISSIPKVAGISQRSIARSYQDGTAGKRSISTATHVNFG
jgi:hypothetical protein